MDRDRIENRTAAAEKGVENGRNKELYSITRQWPGNSGGKK